MHEDEDKDVQLVLPTFEKKKSWWRGFFKKQNHLDVEEDEMREEENYFKNVIDKKL